MKRTIGAIMALMMLAGASAAAFAGVVVDERQTIDRGDGQPMTQSRVVMIQGNKQKSIMDGGARTIITNLDKGTMTLVNAQRKTYVQLPFPPNGPMAAMMGNQESSMNFTKTGGHQTVAGYKCDEYTGTGSMGPSTVSVKGCFSTTAPGAADFTAFQKTMKAKTAGTPMQMTGHVPDGVPMVIEATRKMAPNRPPTVSHMTVTKIRTEQLAADTFEPPAGYTKQELAMPRMPGAMGKPGAGPSSSNKAPE